MSESNHKELIEKYGGKTASVLVQYNAGNTDILLPFTILEVSDLDAGNRPSFSLRVRQIARGSANGDERGLVDVLRTIPSLSPKNLNGEIDLADANSWTNAYINTMSRGGESREETITRKLLEDFIDPIEAIVNSSRSDWVRDYAKWEGLDSYKGVDSILIQPQNFKNGRGSVVEHPNIKSHYLINFAYNIGGDDLQFFQCLADSNGKSIVERSMNNLSAEEIKAIVDLKKRTREVGFIPNTHSSQVEFGLWKNNQDYNPEGHQYSTEPTASILFYQERQFLPFDFDDSIDPEDYHFNRFGHLREPIDIRVLKVDDVTEEELNDGIPSAYVINSRNLRSDQHRHLKPNNLEVYIVPWLSGTVGGHTIEHNNFRWTQKARLTFMNDVIDGNHFYDNYEHGSMIRIDPKKLRD